MWLLCVGTRYKVSHRLPHINQSTVQWDKMAAKYIMVFMFLVVTLFGEVFGINCTVDEESQVGFIVL